MDTTLLDKWLNGTHTAEDLKNLESYPEFAAYQKIDAYSQQIVLPEFDNEGALEDLKKKRAIQTKTKVRVLPTILKVAAILIVLIASYVYINSLPTTTNTSLAETKTILLPDASEVILNESSVLSFVDSQWDDNRELTLQGEAFFKVAKGKKFTVQTAQGAVEVLGTHFNVASTPNSFQVSCYEGKVAVYHNNKKVELQQGSRVVSDNGLLVVSDLYVNKPDWLGNESSFDNIPITKVLKVLEDKYSITVNTQNIDVTLRFTGSFTHTDLEAALQTITIPLALIYSIEDQNTVQISTKEK